MAHETKLDPEAQPEYLQRLNPQQREAVQHFEGPLLVLAGAGSGKTRVLTVRIAHLIDHYGVPPGSILAVTFTNKAAGEMRERIQQLVGEDLEGMWTGTFHSFGAWLMRRHGRQLGYSQRFTILDSDEALRTAKRVMEKLDIDTEQFRPRAVRAEISDAKNELMTAQQYRASLTESAPPIQEVAAKVFQVYQRSLREQDAMDFEDLLVNPVKLFEQNADLLEQYRDRFPFLLVDEYQDTNRAQYRLVERLARRDRNLMVVGDDDQSIYGWRGADIRNILEFEEDFQGARVVRLEQNYRSTQTILKAANAIIEKNQSRKGKTLRTDNAVGEPIRVVRCQDDQAEAKWISKEIERRMAEGQDLDHRDFAVLYRTNAQSRTLEQAFRRRGLPYQIVGGLRFYERREIKDVLGYLRLISNDQDISAFQRCVNYPRRGIGQKTRERILAFADDQGLSPVDAAARAYEADSIHTRGQESLQEFAGMIDHFFGKASYTPVGQLVDEVVQEAGIIESLEEEKDGEDRADNVRELIAAAAEFDQELRDEGKTPGEGDPLTALDLFLQEIALISDIDTADREADAVTLMTLHAAKGLEFPYVFMGGMEKGLFPHSRSFGDMAAMEEERRLCYVGITRAQQEVIMSWAKRRRQAGTYQDMEASRFLQEIPQQYLEKVHASSRGRGSSSRSKGGSGQHPWWQKGASSSQGTTQDQPDVEFEPGDLVEHPHFGTGEVKRLFGTGAQAKALIKFDDVGLKKVHLRYAGLERVIDYSRHPEGPSAQQNR